jgi:hypothetical protein
MPRQGPTVTACASTPAALEALANALGPSFSTTLVHRADRRSRLTVVDRDTQAATEVSADEHGRYWWPWAEPAAVTSDPFTTARAIIRILRPALGIPP